MWLGARHVRDVCGRLHCRGGELADGHMIRMTIGAKGIEGDDDLWTHASQLHHNAPDCLARLCLIELAILVAEQCDLAYAELARRRTQLQFAHATHFFVARPQFIREVTSALPTCGGDDVRLHATGCVRCQRAPNAE